MVYTASVKELRTSLAGALSVGPFAAAPARSQASDWPTHPLRIIVPYAPGGPTDIPACLLAEELAKVLPQRPVVENRAWFKTCHFQVTPEIDRALMLKGFLVLGV